MQGLSNRLSAYSLAEEEAGTGETEGGATENPAADDPTDADTGT